jgi:hypothetical protein
VTDEDRWIFHSTQRATDGGDIPFE